MSEHSPLAHFFLALGRAAAKWPCLFLTVEEDQEPAIRFARRPGTPQAVMECDDPLSLACFQERGLDLPSQRLIEAGQKLGLRPVETDAIVWASDGFTADSGEVEFPGESRITRVFFGPIYSTYRRAIVAVLRDARLEETFEPLRYSLCIWCDRELATATARDKPACHHCEERLRDNAEAFEAERLERLNAESVRH